MSSNFLNRRMDLIHSIAEVSANEDNVLTMDTSYPVKLAGKVIKLFTAVHDYTTKRFILKNSDGVEQLVIASNKVYDFGGNVIEDNVGDEKLYPLLSDVYKNGDYVMAIIDFDTESMYICSQTNFTGMVGGGGDGRVRVFNISGSTPPTDDDVNFDYSFDPEEFNKAAKYELEEGKNAFVKFTNDQVLYEAPVEVVNHETEPPTVEERRITPVAKVNVIDINKLTAVVSKFMFGYMDSISSDKGGTEYVDKLAAFLQINGSMNADFINNYSVTEADMLNSDIIKTSPKKIQDKLLEEYYNIDAAYRSKYRYVLMFEVDEDDFTYDEYKDNMHFIPIDPESGSFTSLFELYNRGFVVNGENVELPSGLRIYGRNFGQGGKNDYRDCYCVWYFQTGPEVRIADYDNDDKLTEDVGVKEYSSQICYLYMASDTPNTPSIARYSLTVDDFSTYLINVNKFLKFFVPTSIEPYDALLPEFNRHILSLSSSNNPDSTRPAHCAVISGNNVLANTIVYEYPSVFDSQLDGNTTILDYSLPITGFDRSSVRFTKRVSPKNHNNIMSIVYKLFNTKNSPTGYIDDYETKKMKTAEMLFTSAIGEEPTEVNYKFVSTRLLSSQEDGYNEGIYVLDSRKLIVSPITLLSVNKIAENSVVSGVPEVTASNFMVVKEIKTNENDDIDVRAQGNVVIRYGKDSNNQDLTAQLYIVAKVSSGEDVTGMPTYTNSDGDVFVYKPANVSDTYTNVMTVGTDRRGTFDYFYYTDNRNRVHRVKYHYDDWDMKFIGSQYNKFIYYTDNIIVHLDGGFHNVNTFDVNDFMRLNSINNHNAYLRAAFNVVAVKNHNGNVFDAIPTIYGWTNTNIGSLIACVDAEYGLYMDTTPIGNTNNSPAISYKAMYLKASSNYNLTVDIDEKIVYAGQDNSANIYGDESIRLSNMIPSSDITFHKDMMTPLVSDTLDVNGGNVYSIKAYIEYMNKASSLSTATNAFSPVLSQVLNVCGITSDIAKTDNTALNFYQNALRRDLKSFDNEASNLFDEVEPKYRAMMLKNHINGTSIQLEYDADTQTEKWVSYDISSDEPAPIEAASGALVFHTNINPKNIFDINFVSIHKYHAGEMRDYTNAYTNNQEKILVNKNQTGTRTTYSISMADSEDTSNPSIVSVNGLDDSTEVDTINWKTMMLSLSNNKSIDILSASLRAIKNVINTSITNATQNISDAITLAENYNTEVAAADTTDPFPAGRHEYDKYRKDKAAEFNNELNIYDFNFGYGYTGPMFNKHRTINNRGVIVFATENGDSYMQQESGGTYDKYDNRPSDIHPKRMYISKDGLLCTKEYYDAEETKFKNDSDYNYPNTYPAAMTLEDIRQSLKTINETLNSLNNRVTAIEQELHPDVP